MAIDHEAHKIRVKAVSDKMNHPMTYNDAGAPKEFGDKNDTLQNQDRAAITRRAWENGEYSSSGVYVGKGKGVKPKRK